MLKLTLVLAAAATVLAVVKREEGSFTEKLAYVARGIFGTKHPRLSHPSLSHRSKHEFSVGLFA